MRAIHNRRMRLRDLRIGCFGGGTGLPSLLGGLKRNPWLELHAIVTMFDSGGSSGLLRDQLGVLPPGDVLKCCSRGCRRWSTHGCRVTRAATCSSR